MQGRWIKAETFIEGVREFVARAGARVQEQDGLTFLLQFPDDQYIPRVSNEGLGMDLSYQVPCGVVPDPATVNVLLQKNWGGVEGTPFFFSVYVEDRRPYLFLETHHFLDPQITSKGIADILGSWRLLWKQARAAL